MSVTRFFERLSDDAALQAKLDGLPVDDREAALAQVVAIAAEAGLAFTRAELDAAMEASGGELADSELDAVSGGGINPCCSSWSLRRLQSVYSMKLTAAAGINPCT